MENNKKDFDLFLSCLEKACKKIESNYIKLDVADSEKQIYRERVYCYELYHRLRCVLGERHDYELNGEVDKAGHSIIKEALGAKKPDFIVHVQGEMKKNLAVIEVKPVIVKKEPNKLEKDLKTLEGFLSEAKYHYAIMLIYGESEGGLPQKIIDKFNKYIKNKNIQIILIWHHSCGEKPKQMNELGEQCVTSGKFSRS